MESPLYQEESEIREVVARFENCEYELQEFSHAKHLTVASWYLCTLTREDALARMRVGLQRFIAHHGRQGYHETITRFWMELLGELLQTLPPEMSTVERTNRAVKTYGDKEVLFRYYSREFVMSDAARREWVEPDIGCWTSMATK